jgi:hypothetical protein
LPTPTGGDLIRMRVEPQNPDGTFEIVNMTARSGTSLTVARAQEGTSAPVGGWPALSVVRPVFTAATMTGFFQKVIYAGDVNAARPVAQEVWWMGFPDQPTNMLDQDVWMPPADPIYDLNTLLGPPGTVRASDNLGSDGTGSGAAQVSGSLYLRSVYCYKGDAFTNLAVEAGTGGWTTVAHSWALVADSNRTVLAISPDNTTAAQTAQTERVFPLTGGWVAPANGRYYFGVMLATSGTGTLPVLANNGLSVAAQKLAASGGIANTGLTTPAAVGVGTVLAALSPVANFAPYIRGT